MSRVSKTIKNAKVTTFFFFITSAIGFYSRSIFLSRLGDDFIGLTATLQSFLSFLNLAELGIGSAMAFALYKSLFKNDYDRLNELLTLIGYLYKKIGKIVLFGGLLLSLFFPFIFKDTTISLVVIYYVFYVCLFSTLLNYFFNYYLIILQTDQKGYIPTAYLQISHITKICLQIAVLYFSNSFILFTTIELITLTIYNILIHKKIKKEYPWIKFFNKGNKTLLTENKGIIAKVKQMFVHRISGFILKSTDNIVIFSFVNLQSVAYINNYYIITGSAAALLSNFVTGTGAAVGSLVAEDDRIKIQKVFWELMSLQHYIGGLLFIGLYYGINPVIGLWLGEQYIMEPHIVTLILVNVYIDKMCAPITNFINAYGIFHDVWAPITEGVLNLLISIVLAYYFGISGVLIGTFISVSLITLGWKPFFLYKNGFKKPVFLYWIGFFKLLLSFIAAFMLCKFLISSFININQESWILLLVSLTQVGIIILIVYSSIMYLVNPGFRELATRILKIIINAFK
ncbi:hypothetical protein ACFQ0I_10950 [Mariniflexile aquimaris]|uniref:O-antigen/teichoic acid export membrane protein n=1 Tax=Mariniflexile aquimaris TaxID=881009 RepID=A0ABW3BVA7_9FLAO